MERYVVLGGERVPDHTPDQRNAIVEILSKRGRFPQVAIVWSDTSGIARAVDMIVVRP
jgi:hypothetical protein